MTTRIAADADSVGTLVATDVGEGVGAIVGEGVGTTDTAVAVGLGGSAVTGGAAVHAVKVASNASRTREFIGRASTSISGPARDARAGHDSGDDGRMTNS